MILGALRLDEEVGPCDAVGHGGVVASAGDALGEPAHQRALGVQTGGPG